MTRPRRSALVILAVLVFGCGGAGGSGVDVSEARLAQPTGPNAALYLSVSSDGGDRLVGASTAAAAAVQVHETTMDGDGTMTMTPVDGFDIDSELVLEPGGKHLMLVDADRLEIGDTVEVTLRFEQAGDVVVQVPVVAPQDAMGEMGVGGG